MLAVVLAPAVAADGRDPTDAAPVECVKVVKAGSRIPVKVCGDERDIRSELEYPQPGVTPADRVSRLGEQFPWLTVHKGGATSGPR